MTLQEHPDYHEGFFDALEGEPLFEGECTKEYEAGWRAWWDVHAIVNDPGFLETAQAARLPADRHHHQFNN